MDLEKVAVGGTEETLQDEEDASCWPKEDATNRHCGKSNKVNKPDRVIVMVMLIVLLGASASTSFLALGITGAHRDQDLRFERQASELVKAFQARWADYEVACLWTHEACRATADQVGRVVDRVNICTREDFSELYLYLREGGLEFSSVSFFTLIFGFEREALEAESRAYYTQRDPDFEYIGVTGINDYFITRGPESFLEYNIAPRPKQEFYLPVHYVEPFESNHWFVEFDTLSIFHLQDEDLNGGTVGEWKPYLSERLLEPVHANSSGYSVYFFHPGIRLPTHPEWMQTGAAGMMIYVPDVLRTAVEGQAEKTYAYIFDNDDPRNDEPAFLVGARIHPGSDIAKLELQEEIELAALEARKDCISKVIPVVNREWTMVVCKAGGIYEPSTVFVVLGGVIIFAACICLAAWFWTTNRRITRINEIRAAAEHEKAVFIVKNAEKAAHAERELNEYIAHEIRNPISVSFQIVGRQLKGDFALKLFVKICCTGRNFCL